MGVHSFNKPIKQWLESQFPAYQKLVSEANRALWLKEVTETTIQKFNLPIPEDKFTLAQYREKVIFHLSKPRTLSVSH